MSLLAIARKELRDVSREKTLVVAFLVQAFIAGFSALLLTGLLAFSDVGATGAVPDTPLAYVGPTDGESVAVYLERVGLDVHAMDEASAWSAFDEGSVLGIVFEQTSDTQHITVVLPEGELQTGLTVGAIQEALLRYEQHLRSDRQDRLDHQILTIPAGDRAASYEFVHATLVPLLVLTPVVLAGAIVGDSLGHERRTGTLAVLRASPAPLSRLVLGKLLVPVALVPFQVLLWAGLLALNGFTIHLAGLLVLATVLAALLAGLGLLVTVLVPDEAVSQAAYAVVVLLVGAAAITMPRDPLNMIALLAAGVPDATTWWSLGLLAAVTLPALWAITRLAERRLRRA